MTKQLSKSLMAGLLLATAPWVVSQAVADEKLDTFQSEDVFNLEYANDPRVSPDGTQVVFVRRSNDIMIDGTRSNLWIASVDGRDLRPLESGDFNASSPRWSPDGKRLAFLSNKEGRTQIYVRWMDTGQTAMISSMQQGAGNLTWSPDGQSLAFTSAVPAGKPSLHVKMPKKPKGAKWNAPVKYVERARYQADGRGIFDPFFTHIFVIPADGGSPRQITSGDYHHRGHLSFSPDSKKIYFSANRSDDWEYESRESDIYAITIADGSLEQITNLPGAESNPEVSENGKKIAYIHGSNEKLAYVTRGLYVMDIDGSNAKFLTPELDRSVSNIQWDDNQKIYFQYNDHGVGQVGVVMLNGGRVSKLNVELGSTSLGRPYSSGSYHLGGKGIVAYTLGSAQRPADLHVRVGAATRTLTALNEDVLGHKKMGELKEINYKSSFDGTQIQGWYLLPPDFDPAKKYPLILEIHGGPHLSYGPHFSAEMQRFAAEGYVVFYDNHRGSTSYGRDFALKLQYKYSSEEDYADHDSGVNAMIDLGFIDKDQLYITGGSAGGIASAYAIGLTDRYRAAAVAKPIINWTSKVLTADSGLGQIPTQFPGAPWDHLEHYWKRSPIANLGKIVTPTLLLTGESDKRTPTTEAEMLYQGLKLRKIDTMMVRFPDTPHGIAGRPSRLIAKVENIMAWFKKYSK